MTVRQLSERRRIQMTSRPRPPSIGVTPRFIVEEGRLQDLSTAIERRTQEHMPVPFDWIQEYNELLERIEKRNSK